MHIDYPAPITSTRSFEYVLSPCGCFSTSFVEALLCEKYCAAVREPRIGGVVRVVDGCNYIAVADNIFKFRRVQKSRIFPTMCKEEQWKLLCSRSNRRVLNDISLG